MTDEKQHDHEDAVEDANIANAFAEGHEAGREDMRAEVERWITKARKDVDQRLTDAYHEGKAEGERQPDIEAAYKRGVADGYCHDTRRSRREWHEAYDLGKRAAEREAQEAAKDVQKQVEDAWWKGHDAGVHVGHKHGRKGLLDYAHKAYEKGRRLGQEEGEAKGRVKGLEQGRVKGLEQGRAEAWASIDPEITRLQKDLRAMSAELHKAYPDFPPPDPKRKE